MEPIDAIVVTLMIRGNIQGSWVYSIENADPDRVNGSLVTAQIKMKELIEKHNPNSHALSQDSWVKIYEDEQFVWGPPNEDGLDGAFLTFSSRNTP
jgi:hypothetical protein